MSAGTARPRTTDPKFLAAFQEITGAKVTEVAADSVRIEIDGPRFVLAYEGRVLLTPEQLHALTG